MRTLQQQKEQFENFCHEIRTAIAGFAHAGIILQELDNMLISAPLLSKELAELIADVKGIQASVDDQSKLVTSELDAAKSNMSSEESWVVATQNVKKHIENTVKKIAEQVDSFTQKIVNNKSIPITTSSLECLSRCVVQQRWLISNEQNVDSKEAQKLSCNFIDIKEVVEPVMCDLQVFMDKKKLKAVLDLPTENRLLKVDVIRLQMILKNLVNNAIKFTEAGAITIAVQYKNGQVSIAVSDTGRGMDEEGKTRLFKRFSQVEEATDSKCGSGLGLTIVENQVRAMGGKISFTSLKNEGTTFTITFSCEYLALDINELKKTFAQPSNDEIIYAEDNLLMQKIVLRSLEKAAYPHKMVQNGRELLKLWASSRVGVIVTDDQMPEMFGSEATGIIRYYESKYGLPRTPIICISATFEKSSVMSLQFDECLPKNCTMQQLHAAIDKCLAKNKNKNDSSFKKVISGTSLVTKRKLDEKNEEALEEKVADSSNEVKKLTIKETENIISQSTFFLQPQLPTPDRVTVSRLEPLASALGMPSSNLGPSQV